jgi:hypothetical protein
MDGTESLRNFFGVDRLKATRKNALNYRANRLSTRLNRR